jgi:hypothetical protein
MADSLLEGDNAALIATSDSRSMVLWTDEKKKDFLKTFYERTGTAKRILYYTAVEISNLAHNRRFLSRKHLNQIDRVSVKCPYYNWDNAGRTEDEVQKIGKERADSIIKNLPSLNSALKVVDSDTAELIEKYEVLKAELQAVKDALDDASEDIELEDLDPNMTIAEFRKFIKDNEELRFKLVRQSSEKGLELQNLDRTICKRLYAGVPGISEALIKIINEHYERITALGQVERRVEERVKFGDSPEALSILEHFEKDEVSISDNVKAEFEKALEALQISKKVKKEKKNETSKKRK